MSNQYSSVDKGFAYISFVLSIITILDVIGRYLFAENTTSFGLTRNSSVELFFIGLLTFISIFFLSKEKTNANNLLKVGYLYAFISILIYIVTAYQYILGDNILQNFPLEIILLFIASFIATISILRRFQDTKYLVQYAYFFTIGLFFVFGILFFKIVITHDEEIRFFTIMLYLIAGVIILFFLFFLGQETSSTTSNIKKIHKPKDERISDDAQY